MDLLLELARSLAHKPGSLSLSLSLSLFLFLSLCLFLPLNEPGIPSVLTQPATRRSDSDDDSLAEQNTNWFASPNLSYRCKKLGTDMAATFRNIFNDLLLHEFYVIFEGIMRSSVSRSFLKFFLQCIPFKK